MPKPKDITINNMAVKKNIAIIAHDNRKDDLLEWVSVNKNNLAKHNLCGTGTTAGLIADQTGLDILSLKSGPLGGDLQIGSRIAEGTIDFMVFFWDPLEAQPHDPDIKALLRIAVLYDIPIANNKSSADFILTSPLMNMTYDRQIVDYCKIIDPEN